MSPVGIGAIDMDNTFGYVVLVVLIVAAYFRIRSRRRTRQQSQAPVLYRGTELRAALADAPGKSAWYVCADGDVAVEEQIEARPLGNAHHNGQF